LSGIQGLVKYQLNTASMISLCWHGALVVLSIAGTYGLASYMVSKRLRVE
jgi:hypothetical protein